MIAVQETIDVITDPRYISNPSGSKSVENEKGKFGFQNAINSVPRHIPSNPKRSESQLLIFESINIDKIRFSPPLIDPRCANMFRNAPTTEPRNFILEIGNATEKNLNVVIES